MNFHIVHILVIVFISGVIGLKTTKLSVNDFDPPIINGKNASDVPAVTTVNSANITTQIPTTTPPEPPTTLPPSPNTTTTPITTTTTEKPTPTTISPVPEPTTTPTIAPPANVTTTTESTTTTTATTTTAAPAHKGRHFDGPSFFGGIILASGLMAIGFVSWKFYKARTERNYHTL